MARKTTHFICSACGAVHPRWLGRCPDCNQWDTLEEQRAPDRGAEHDPQRGVADTGPTLLGDTPQACPIAEVEANAYPRLPTGLSELDRVLGGEGPDAGLVPGAAVLIGGDPGIGKSTLLLQAAHGLARTGRRVLYVTSEESPQQTRMRASRLGVDHPELFVLADTNLARVVAQTQRVQPAVVVIDSIQMIYKGDLPAPPGSVTQLRACCTELVFLAKSTGIAVLLVGHVTKEGRLAGPRLLEHLVDAVLYFEGDRYHSHRVLRAIKNRYGSTLEVGLFEMSDAGMREVRDGAGLLAAEYRPRPGSAVCPVLQGTRCLLVEMQALTATSFLGAAKRRTSGVDPSRLSMLIAVLEKRAELRLADQDVFASAIGGVRVIEPAADLALALAVAGAHYNRKPQPGTCAIGEVGLSGEIRHVQALGQRIAEAARLGFKRILTPPVSVEAPRDAQVLPVETLDRAIALLD